MNFFQIFSIVFNDELKLKIISTVFLLVLLLVKFLFSSKWFGNFQVFLSVTIPHERLIQWTDAVTSKCDVTQRCDNSFTSFKLRKKWNVRMWMFKLNNVYRHFPCHCQTTRTSWNAHWTYYTTPLWRLNLFPAKNWLYDCLLKYKRIV